MSRLRRFAHSLFSGYVQLAANICFTLGTVPLALHYLPTEEFGLWASVAQLAQYITLVDFGFNASASRIVVDYKDQRESGEYGSTILTIALVGLAQGILILVTGIALAFVVGPLLHISPALSSEFTLLLIGQSVVTAVIFGTEFLNMLFGANQMYYFMNYASAFSMGVFALVMWIGFAHGCGVFSLLWGQGASCVVLIVLRVAGCRKLGLLPKRGQWGRPSWGRFREVFAFARDVFLFSIGNQFINASQTLLATRLFGLEAAAIWNVSTRSYIVLVTAINRVFEFSAPALAEMIVRQERERLIQRFREITVVAVNLAVASGVMLAVCNGPFVVLWTGVVGWTPKNDALLAVWLAVGTLVRFHTGLIGQTKDFRGLRYIYFAEGSIFVISTIVLHHLDGMTLMLATSIVCTCCFSLPYGLRRNSAYTGLTLRQMALWHRGTVFLTLTTLPVGIVIWWVTRAAPPLKRLAMEVPVLGAWTAWMFLRYGLDRSLRQEASRHAPAWMKPILRAHGN